MIWMTFRGDFFDCARPSRKSIEQIAPGMFVVYFTLIHEYTNRKQTNFLFKSFQNGSNPKRFFSSIEFLKIDSKLSVTLFDFKKNV